MNGFLISWMAPLGIGLIAGVAGAVAGGAIAKRAVRWHHVSSPEGAAGYFVVFQAFLAFIVSGVLGTIISRVAIGQQGSWLMALGLALGAVLGLVGLIGIIARLRADVPPTWQGEQLLLAVEISWPAAQAPRPTTNGRPTFIELAALAGNAVRARRQGPLWFDDARHAEGRYIVPGAVEIFTSRGRRVLTVRSESPDVSQGFLLPLPAHPGQDQREWSDWLPHARPGSTPLPDGVRYRFQIVKRNEPVRVQNFGPFTVGTIVREFLGSRRPTPETIGESVGEFVLHHWGKPIILQRPEHHPDDPKSTDTAPQASATDSASERLYDRITSVRTIPGPSPALVIEAEFSGPIHRSTDHFLLHSEGEELQVHFISPARPKQEPLQVLPSTSSRPGAPQSRGNIDERTFASPGRYVFLRAVLDTRSLTIHRLTFENGSQEVLSGPALLSWSPDEAQFARLIRRDQQVVIEVVTLVDSSRRDVPLTRHPTPSGNWDSADTAWFDNYFEWVREPAGAYQLARRSPTTPLPIHEQLSSCIS